MKRPYILPILGFIATLIFFCVTYYGNAIYMYPSLIHQWAQGDRMALAIRFYDDGMNFFKPATLCLFSKEGVVGVECPLQAYLAAALAHIFGREHISFIFRLQDTIISCIGLLFLFLAGYKRTKDFVVSMVAPLFIFCSPIFIYYTCNYMPDTAGASFAFVGFYFVLNYLDDRKTRDFILAGCFLALGTLIKMSVITYMAGFFCVVLIQKIREKDLSVSTTNLSILGVVLVSCSAILGSYLWMKYLNARYEASVFMSAASPFKDGKTFESYINYSFKRVWMKEYLVLPQYLLLPAIVAPGIYMLKKARKTQLLQLLFFYTFFAVIVFFLLGGVMIAHDYYIIAIFLPLFAIALLSSLWILHSHIPKPGLMPVRISLFVSVLIMFFFADFHTYERFKPDYQPFAVDYHTEWLEPGKKLMDELGVAKNEPIAVLDEGAPNTALTYLDRKGHVISVERWRGHKKILLDYLRENHVQLLVVEQRNIDNRLSQDSTMFDNFDLVIKKDRINVLKLTR